MRAIIITIITTKPREELGSYLELKNENISAIEMDSHKLKLKSYDVSVLRLGWMGWFFPIDSLVGPFWSFPVGSVVHPLWLDECGKGLWEGAAQIKGYIINYSF